jgi:hypothetical protein
MTEMIAVEGVSMRPCPLLESVRLPPIPRNPGSLSASRRSLHGSSVS